MPQRDPNGPSDRRRNRRQKDTADDNDDFWGRSERTRQEDRKTGRRGRKKDAVEDRPADTRSLPAAASEERGPTSPPRGFAAAETPAAETAAPARAPGPQGQQIRRQAPRQPPGGPAQAPRGPSSRPSRQGQPPAPRQPGPDRRQPQPSQEIDLTGSRPAPRPRRGARPGQRPPEAPAAAERVARLTPWSTPAVEGPSTGSVPASPPRAAPGTEGGRGRRPGSTPPSPAGGSGQAASYGSPPAGTSRVPRRSPSTGAVPRSPGQSPPRRPPDRALPAGPASGSVPAIGRSAAGEQRPPGGPRRPSGASPPRGTGSPRSPFQPPSAEVPPRAPAVAARPLAASSSSGVPALAPGARAPRSGVAGADTRTFTTAPHDPVADDLYGDPYEDSYSTGYNTRLASGYDDVVPGAGPETHTPYGDLELDVLDDEAYDDDGEEPPRRRWTRLLLVVGIILGVVVALLVVVGLWVSRQINPSGGPRDPVTIELTSGMSTPEIAQELADKGVVSDARIFTFYARFRGDGDIRAGTYEGLRTNMSMGEVLDVLADGPDWGEGEALLLPGRTVDEMVALLGDRVSSFDEAGLQAAVAELDPQYLPDGEDNPEGFLAPGEYDLEGASEADFIRMMADRFDEIYEELEVDRRAEELDIGGDVELSGYDIVIVASMIERETDHGPEKPQIARVIYNRLAEDRPLGIDATSCYEKTGSCLPLSAADLEGTYSTRDRPGLPPTPIAAPSRESLEAALDPADGTWDHYVLDVEAGDGSHVITDDQDVWEEARQRCVDEGLCG